MTNDAFEVELSAMAHGGSALGRHEGRTVFIPYTIPGERVLARVVQEKGRVVFAEGVTLLDASADRVYPRCPHFGPGKCGRCQWQHIDYPAQLLLKQDVLGDQLERIGGFADVEVRSIIPSPIEWSYNYHMTLLIGADNKPGFQSADGRGVYPITECHIIHPELLALYQSLELEDLSGISRIKLQIGTDDAHMMILYMESEDAPTLETDLPTSINMLLPDGEPVNLIGESHTRYAVGERVFRVTAGSSFRANVAQLGSLIGEVLNALELTGTESVLDLYAGVGLFSAFIAPQASLLTVVESYPPAVTDADENLADFENIDLIEGEADDPEVLEALSGERFDAALVDPPADGLSTDVIDALAAFRIPRLVYVSGDPATLARDAKRLAGHGYRLSYVQPIDLNPQTYYVDSVARFDLGG